MENHSDKYLKDPKDRYNYLKEKIKESYKELEDVGEDQKATLDDFQKIDIKKVKELCSKSTLKLKEMMYLQAVLFSTLQSIEDSKELRRIVEYEG